MPPLNLRQIAMLESHRQAHGVAELADVAMPIMGGIACYTAPGSWTNQAIALALEGPVTSDEIDQLTAFYTDRGHEPRLEVCPFTDETLIEGLAERGYNLIEFEAIMARFVEPDEPIDAAPPDGITIRAIDPGNQPDCEAWVRASNACFLTTDPTRDAQQQAEHEAAFSETSRRLLQHPRTTAFIAESEGNPIATAAMEIARPLAKPSGASVVHRPMISESAAAMTAELADEPIACLFAGSVLPEFRRRGVQAALIAARAAHAQAQGVRLVTTHSKPSVATYRNAERQGFVHVYTNAVLVMRRAGLTRSV